MVPSSGTSWWFRTSSITSCYIWNPPVAGRNPANQLQVVVWDFSHQQYETWIFFFSQTPPNSTIFFLRWYVGLAPGVLFGRIGLGSQDSQNPDQKTGGGGVVFLGLRVLNRFSQLHKKAWARFLDGPKIVYRKVVVKLMDQGISRVWVCQLTFIRLYIYI